MTVELDDLAEQLTALLAEIRSVRAAVSAAGVATIDPGGFPGPVAAGELIESAWGNAVAEHTKFHSTGGTQLAATFTASSTGWRIAYDVTIGSVTFDTVMTAVMLLGWAADEVAVRAGARMTRKSDMNPGVEINPQTAPIGEWRYFTMTREWPVPANTLCGYTGDLNVITTPITGPIYVSGHTTWQRRRP